jgi:ribonuclease PH
MPFEQCHGESVMLQRNPEGRQPGQIRPVTIETGINRYAEGSVLIRSGNTHVLCTASFDESVPPWLVGKGRGWVTAEYSMLPRSTHTRSKRDREKVSGRTQEIQRLIARALRSMVDLKGLGERQIIVDCDVIQADGGTRTASITGGAVALAIALHRLQKDGKLAASSLKGVWIDTVSAISIGKKGGNVLTDLDYNEDSGCDVDMNFVITGKGGFVEVQGTAEGEAFSKSDLDQMTLAAQKATEDLKKIQLTALEKLGITLG